MTKRKLLIWIPAAAILLNGLGYLIVTRMRAPAPPLSARTPASAGTTTTTETIPSNQPTPAAGQDDSEGAKSKEKLALVRRANGLAALEAGDYDKAMINFTEARALLGDKANVGDLLRVAEQLRRRPPGPPRPRANVPPPVVAARPAARPTTRRVATKEEPSPEIVAPQPSGLLIVSTTPRNLLVQIDDTAMDLTPMRTRVKAGGHRIALLDGERRVYETTIEIKDGGTATLIKDLSRELAAESAPEPPRVPTAVAAPPPAPDEQPPSRATEPPDLQPAARQPNPVGATPAARARGTTGALQVTSPGLYGVVWINGRPRGYPPIEVRDLPAGPVKIEVRVNGIQKRTSTVDVVPGLTTAVKLR